MSTMFYRAFEDRHRGSRELITERLKAYLPFVMPLQSLYDVCPALDLGCGRGEWIELLQSQGFQAKGVDLDQGMLEACRDLGLLAVEQDALTALASLPDESQTIVSAFHLVEHIPFPDVQTLVSEALRVLKPGGLLIMETPNAENLVVGTNNFFMDPTHEKPIPHDLLSFLTEYSGFVRTKVLRLQEDATLKTSEQLTLMNVLNGASPDYAIVAQKDAETALLDHFTPSFDRYYGLSLEDLAQHYDQQIKQRTSQATAQLDLSEINAQLSTVGGELQHLRETQHSLWLELQRAQKAEQALLSDLQHARQSEQALQAEAEQVKQALQAEAEQVKQASQAEMEQLKQAFQAEVELLKQAERWLHEQLQDMRQQRDDMLQGELQALRKQREESLEAEVQLVRSQLDRSLSQRLPARILDDVLQTELDALRHQRDEAMRAELHQTILQRDEALAKAHHLWLQTCADHDRLQAMTRSSSWRLTAPLRWMIGSSRAFPGQVKRALLSVPRRTAGRAVRFVLTRPQLRDRLYRIVKRCPRLFAMLKGVAQNGGMLGGDVPSASQSNIPAHLSGLSAQARQVYHDLTKVIDQKDLR